METQTASLRKVGGSVMVTVPPAYLEKLQLQPGNIVGIAIEGGRLLIDPVPKPHYSLAELLAASDYSQPQPASEREWVDAPAQGEELL